MLEPRPVKVTLELCTGDGPINGRIRHASGALEAFAGWLELSTVLERARRMLDLSVLPQSGEHDRRTTATPEQITPTRQ